MPNQKNLRADFKKDFLLEVLTKNKIIFITGERDIFLPELDRTIFVNLEDNTVSSDSNTWFIISAEIGMSILTGGVV